MRKAPLATTALGASLGAGLITIAALSGPPAGTTLGVQTVPLALAGDIQKYGTTCPQLTAPLLAAQLYEESGFDATARSRAGAEGIAQFLPSTFATWGVSATGGAPNIWNSDDGVASMANYDCGLARELANVPGDPVDNMLAGYNAGPYAVISARGIPNIPETRNYVARINALTQTFAATTSDATETGGESSAAETALVFAYDNLGDPYRWGGNGDAASHGQFDCSGLTQAAYASAGVKLPRVAADQYFAGLHVALDQLRPGDLIFYAFDTNDPSTIHHVGIYAGGGEIIDAPHTGAAVRFDPLVQAGLIGAVRPVA